MGLVLVPGPDLGEVRLARTAVEALAVDLVGLFFAAGEMAAWHHPEAEEDIVRVAVAVEDHSSVVVTHIHLLWALVRTHSAADALASVFEAWTAEAHNKQTESSSSKTVPAPRIQGLAKSLFVHDQMEQTQICQRRPLHVE